MEHGGWRKAGNIEHSTPNIERSKSKMGGWNQMQSGSMEKVGEMANF
jgi:hypothetical protein